MTNKGDTAQRPLSPDETARWTRIGMLAAFAMLLSYLETFIPIPIPGVKLGLANIAVLVALARHDVAGAFCIAVLKVLAAGLLFGSPVTMAYSAAGSVLSFALMAPLSSLRSLHLVMLSVVGAIAHEAGQLMVAMAMLGTPLVWYSAPLLLVAGIVTGALCGYVAHRTVVLLDEGAVVHGAPVFESPSVAAASSAFPGERPLDAKAKAALVTFLVFCVLVLHAASPAVLAVCLVASIVICACARVDVRDVLRALRPLVAILAITFVAQVACNQHGEELVRVFGIALTWDALGQTATMTARLLSIAAASLAVMNIIPATELVDAVSWMLEPLRRLGVRTQGFVLALNVALTSIPLLAESARQQGVALGKSAGTREFWHTTVPAFIASAYLR